MKAVLTLIWISLAACAWPTCAFALDAQVQQIGQTFVDNLPADWKPKLGRWEYFNPEECFTAPTGVCYGNNPTSPYGYPSFSTGPGGDDVFSFRMNPSEAVVLIFRTPPSLRYFSFAQYLVKRPGDKTAVFASLSDSLNHLKIGTTGSQTAGVNVFNQYAAVVWTADKATFGKISALLQSSGLPQWAINFLPFPLEISPAGAPSGTTVKINLGYGQGADLINMLMRTALPTISADFDQYRQEKPFFVVKVRPAEPQASQPAPALGYASETSGVSEGEELRKALDQLVADVRSNYSGKKYKITELGVKFIPLTGWDCIYQNMGCAADNHDALYSVDSNSGGSGVVKFRNSGDFVIIAGVNHQKTGKATYINHSIYDTKKFAGIVSIADQSLTTQSALYHAGVTDPADPRNKLYQSLYAYVISYKCAGISYCLAIPAPTVTNPIGLAPGSPFFIMGRKYLEPRTKVRPSAAETIPHRALLATRP